MPGAPYPKNESQRIDAVRKTGLVGTPAEERFDKITRLARQLFDVPMAAIDFTSEKVAWVKSGQGFDAIEALRKDSYCHYTVLSDNIYLVPDARLDPQVCDSAASDVWVFYAGVPLHFEGERVGVLCIGDSKTRNFTLQQLAPLYDLAELAERELEVAALSEAQLTLAMTNEELEKKVNIDPITRLWNRNAILDITGIELEQATNKLAIALLVIDIDNFKNINETYGHNAGDQVLRAVAERMRQSIRPMDALGRLGGDEFLVVLTNAAPNDMFLVTDKIREEIAKTPIDFEKNSIRVTCSIGCVTSDGSKDVEALLQDADQALERAKSVARNAKA